MKNLPKEDAKRVPGGVMQPNPGDTSEIPDPGYPQFPVSDGGCTSPPTK